MMEPPRETIPVLRFARTGGLSGGARPKMSETDKLKGICQAVRAAEGKGLPVTRVAKLYDKGAYLDKGGLGTRGPLVDRFSRQGALGGGFGRAGRRP
jgi:hypothetical protein